MNEHMREFIRETVTRAVDGFLKGYSKSVTVRVDRPDRSCQFCVVIEHAPPRHGCGWEQPALWAHTNEAGIFKSSSRPGLNVARIDKDDLTRAISSFIFELVDGQERIKVQIIPLPLEGGPWVPSHAGDSRSGEFWEVPDYNGM